MAHAGDDEEATGLKPRKAAIDDDFWQHPDSGAFIRNPLREKGIKAKARPILMSEGEYNHNCLDETLSEWHCISVTESGLRDMLGSSTDAHSMSMSRRVTQRAGIGRLQQLSHGYEFVVQLRKSTYVPARGARRRAIVGKDDGVIVHIDKLNIEVCDVGGAALRIENIAEGLVAVWNRVHPSFRVKVGDLITRVNGRRRDTALMLEEMQASPDIVRLTMQRAPPDRHGANKDLPLEYSVDSLGADQQAMVQMASVHSEPALHSNGFSSAALAHPERKAGGDAQGAPHRRRPLVA